MKATSLVGCVLIAVVVAGCSDEATPEQKKERTAMLEENGERPHTFYTFEELVEGYGVCTFAYAADYAGNGGLTLVGCKPMGA